MNKILYILPFVVCFTTHCSGDTLRHEEIIPRFYVLLSRDAKPTVMDEQEFFGDHECDDVRSLLLSKTKESPSQTPIWDYLRNHREMFLPENLPDMNTLKVEVYKPCNGMSIFKRGEWTVKDGGTKVLVLFSTKRVSNSAYVGLSSVVFTLGQSCYLEIGGTLIAREAKLLVEKVYNATR